MQQHPLVVSFITTRHATQDDHQISRDNPNTGLATKKNIYIFLT